MYRFGPERNQYLCLLCFQYVDVTMTDIKDHLALHGFVVPEGGVLPIVERRESAAPPLPSKEQEELQLLRKIAKEADFFLKSLFHHESLQRAARLRLEEKLIDWEVWQAKNE